MVPLPTLDSALAVRDMVARLIADIYDGKTHPRIAAGLASLLNLLLRAIEITEITKIPDLQRRLAEMEKAMAKASAKMEDAAAAENGRAATAGSE